MRAVLKPLAGGVLALLLAVSASPAQAFSDPVQSESPTVVAPVEEPEESGANAGAETGSDAGADGSGAEPTEPPAEDPAAADDASAEGDADSAAEETPADEAAGIEGSGSEGDDSGDETAEEDPAADEAAAGDDIVTEAPASIDLAGSLLVVSDEAVAELYDEADEHNHDGESVAGAEFIATEAGPLVPVDLEQLAGAGDLFSGTVTLTEPAIAAVDAALAESETDTLTEGEVLELALEAAQADGQALPVEGELTPLTGEADAAAAKAHSADVVFYTGGRNHTDANITSLMTTVSNYWKTQSKSSINGIKLNSIKRVSGKSRAQLCNYSNLWVDGASRFNRTVDQYRNGSADGRHLIVLIDEDCGGAAGWGSLGSFHRGGVVWVDLGLFKNSGSAQPTANFATTLAHEIGHNLGLGHGNARSCTGTTVDAKSVQQWSAAEQLNKWKPAGTACSDIGYGDKWNVMGSGYVNLGGNKPPALAVTQKDALGLLAASEIKKISWNGTRTHTVTLSNAGGTSGVRAIKVSTPAAGSTFYVEYRSGAGQDSAQAWANGAQWDAPSFAGKVSTGVQVLKNHAASNAWFGNNESVVVPQKRSGVRYQTLKAGQNMRPYGDLVQVKVVSTTASSAKVQIVYAPYADVPYSHTHFNGITWMYNKNYAAHDTKFKPTGNMTRQSMAVMLFRMKAPANYKVGTKKLPFADVPKSHKYYKQIYWMWEKGYAASATKFNPTGGVTRQAMATFLYRLEKGKYKAKTKSNPYSDVSTKNAHYKTIMWMYSNGLAAKSSKYNPSSLVTRQAMATFLWRVYS